MCGCELENCIVFHPIKSSFAWRRATENNGHFQSFIADEMTDTFNSIKRCGGNRIFRFSVLNFILLAEQKFSIVAPKMRTVRIPSFMFY